jgi:hypothetical protein
LSSPAAPVILIPPAIKIGGPSALLEKDLALPFRRMANSRVPRREQRDNILSFQQHSRFVAVSGLFLLNIQGSE